MPTPPPADPQTIRACLTPVLAAEFDQEWAIVLEHAKRSKDLAPVHELLTKWRDTAYLELCDPGAYLRLLGKVEQIRRTGTNPTAGSFDDLQSMILRLVHVSRETSVGLLPRPSCARHP